jgi:hypothetical protein
MQFIADITFCGTNRQFSANNRVQWLQMKFIYPLLILILLIPGAGAAEEVRYYDIELIIFESLDPSAKLSESWKHEASMEVPPLAVELGQPYPGPIPKEFDPKLAFKVLTSNQLQLTEEAKLLSTGNNYRILLHTAWRQPGMDADTALPVHINLSFLETAASTSSQIPKPLPSQASVLAPSGDEQTRSILNGYVKIILSRYLHADINLMYTTNIPMTVGAPAPLAPSDNPEFKPIQATQPTVYQLSQTRKMRSKEVHYIDHPVIGVLVLATPYESQRR